jgi:16S rRNA (guanine966-N2)-methyltransferase
MRVVAGTARGRELRAPAGRSTRPTSDRVREAMFSILSSLQLVEGSTVLDLFAGSGALGIEALSRGARRAVFIDIDQSAIQAIRDNLTVLGDTASNAAVQRADVLSSATAIPAADLAFADPPYAFDRWGDLLSALGARVGTLVAETGSPLDLGPTWETVKVKKYGGTVVTVARPVTGSRVLARQEGDI